MRRQMLFAAAGLTICAVGFAFGYQHRARAKPQVSMGMSGRFELRVVGVERGSAAEEAGIRPGDTVLTLGGRAIHNADAFARVLQAHKPGDVIEVGLQGNCTELAQNRFRRTTIKLRVPTEQ